VCALPDFLLFSEVSKNLSIRLLSDHAKPLLTAQNLAGIVRSSEVVREVTAAATQVKTVFAWARGLRVPPVDLGDPRSYQRHCPHPRLQVFQSEAEKQMRAAVQTMASGIQGGPNTSI
jgi:hypothetical protein